MGQRISSSLIVIALEFSCALGLACGAQKGLAPPYKVGWGNLTAKRLPLNTESFAPFVPWKKMAGNRTIPITVEFRYVARDASYKWLSGAELTLFSPAKAEAWKCSSRTSANCR